MAGAVTGLGLWFSYTSAFAIPALLLVGFWSLRSHFLPVLLGIPLGFALVAIPNPNGERCFSRLGPDGLRWISFAGRVEPMGMAGPPFPAFGPPKNRIGSIFLVVQFVGFGLFGLRTMIRDKEQGALRWWVPPGCSGIVDGLVDPA